MVSLLPLVEGARMGTGLGADYVQAVGLVGGMWERQLPDTLPGVDEQQEEEIDPYSPWHGLSGKSGTRKCFLDLCYLHHFLIQHDVLHE